MNKAILHISSYYIGKSLYANLIRELNEMGLKQYVYVPVRNKASVGRYQIDGLRDLFFYYENILRPNHRFFYFRKIRSTYNALKTKVSPEQIGLTHAHSLFSDGGIAYKLKQEYNIPYIVAIRSTDLHAFLKYMIHLRPFALKMLKEASAIVFINPSDKEKLIGKYVPESDRDNILKKSICIPNGVDNFWHENKAKVKDYQGNSINLLYVGKFLKRKNIPLIVDAALKLDEKYNVKLTIVGGGVNPSRKQEDKNTLMAFEKARREGLQIDMIRQINDKEILSEYYREADVFVMPSYYETFGLVYIEAISQGTPIIYTKNDGIAGFFKEGEVGYGITSFSEIEVMGKIEKILQNYNEISTRCLLAVDPFRWKSIAKQYFEVYNNC